MKIIKEKNYNDQEYKNLKNGESFIYECSIHIQFEAWKVNSDYAVFKNAYDRFILAKAYKNCLSIGDGHITEYNSIEKAFEVAKAKSNICQSRELSGLRRKDFAEKYNIPIRTVEDWESGKSNAPEYVLDLLERAVREDFGLPRIYRVYSISSGRVDEEFEIFKTYSKSEAIKRARKEREINQRDNQPEQIEVRLYEKDIDDPDCECYDYDVVEC